MNLLEKVRNFFYDDEEYEEVKTKKMPSLSIKERKDKTKVKELKEDVQEEKQEISERELFKAERTFNFPMDMDEEYTNVKEPNTNIKKEELKTNISEPKKEESNYSGIRDYARYATYREEQPSNQVKKFKPTPVISPIYGIMDKNYKKEDLIKDSVNQSSQSGIVDYDSVRKRAYANVYEDEEKTVEEKGIFYNLDEEKNDDTEDVKIVYNDVTFEEDDDENVTIGQKIEEYEESTLEDNNEEEVNESPIEEDIDEESQILSETKEQDLFNLIDNMYNSDEEDEEEEVE